MACETLPGARVSKEAALLIVDMVSDFSFEDGDRLFKRSLQIVDNLALLKRRLKSMDAPVVYVNDELGHGRDKLNEDLYELERRSAEAAEILSLIKPDDDDHWISKPQRSGFYGTPLGSLLLSLEVSSVIVAGVTTDICVLFTAHDAYMRGYSVNVPSDCCTAVEDAHHDQALRFMKRVAKARLVPSTSDRWSRFTPRVGTYSEGEKVGSILSSPDLVSLAVPN